MLSKKENFLETLKKDGAPDRLVNQWEAVELIAPDPVLLASFPPLEIGGMAKDNWGVTRWVPEGQPNSAPYHTEETIVLKDITNWRDQINVPHYDFPAEEWELIQGIAAAVDRNKKLVTLPYYTGLFERTHALMGFEGALTSMLEFPDYYAELCEAIGAERLHETEMLIENVKPDMIMFHDDWGMKTNLFMNPKKWRKFIKPHYAKLYKMCNEADVIIMHHADSFLEPIVDDMIELGIDLWQGTLPENDIPKLQEQIAGRMAMMGGIDASLVDRQNVAEDIVRGETRRACETYGPAGNFIPCMTYGGPESNVFPGIDAIVTDEINKYNMEIYGIASEASVSTASPKPYEIASEMKA
jgi:hypothetical protein